MSLTKHLIERDERQVAVATGIAIQAGVLQSCAIHNDVVFQTGGDIVGAYKLGVWKFKRGEHNDVFETVRDMTDQIKKVVEECGNDECSYCNKD
jgi:hypothetical protein